MAVNVGVGAAPRADAALPEVAVEDGGRGAAGLAARGELAARVICKKEEKKRIRIRD